MKKILCLILMVMFTAVGIVSADYIRGSAGTEIRVYSSTQTQQGSSESVPLATIGVGTRILGYTVLGYSGAALVALYDTASSPTTADVISEAAAASGESETVWFPMPYVLKTRLLIAFGTSYTSVVIYYE